MTEASSGAVKHDIDAPLGERISQPLRELGPLQDRLRELRLRPPSEIIIEADPDAPPLDAEVGVEIAPELIEPAHWDAEGTEPDHQPVDAAAGEPTLDDAPHAEAEDIPVYDASALVDAAEAVHPNDRPDAGDDRP